MGHIRYILKKLSSLLKNIIFINIFQKFKFESKNHGYRGMYKDLVGLLHDGHLMGGNFSISQKVQILNSGTI